MSRSVPGTKRQPSTQFRKIVLGGSHIRYKAPVRRWDEGLPLGNGLLGVLVWGDGNPLNLSVDRSDLWDNRADPRTKNKDFNWKKITELVNRDDMKTLSSMFEKVPGGALHPTKLPCGRLQLDFGNVVTARSKRGHSFESRLDFTTAISTTRIGVVKASAWVHAEKALIVVRSRNAKPRVSFLSPFGSTRRNVASLAKDPSGKSALGLGYPLLEEGTKGDVRFIRQRCAERMSYSVAWTTAPAQDGSILYVTVIRADDDQDPVTEAVLVLAEARAAGVEKLQKTHVAWWRKYWSKGHIHLPDARIEHLWYSEMYKLAAAAREDTPPISLQAVWTADEMAIPPWRGDYHHDLNTQLSYWPVHTAGRLDQSRGFANWLASMLPAYRAFARDFYGAPGANVPCQQSLEGNLIPGWAPYVYSRANAGWLCQHLWWHYRYTLDQEFLRDTGYPFLSEVARFCASQLTRDQQGVYHLLWSSSPEYFDNSRKAWAADGTYDLSCIRYALQVASAAAKILGKDRNEAREWDRIRAHLQPYHLAPTRGLAIWEGQALTETHRHHSHLMPIFPLGDIHIEGSDRDREIIRNSLKDLERQGTGLWCGYSFTWLACLGARVREPNRALWALNQYLDAFVSPNTFHLNGDFKQLGVSSMHYRPFTLEGNFAAAHAINEMLLQSWGGRIRLFPSIPEAWRDVTFTGLRAEGAFVVSAWRTDGQFARVKILSEKGTPIRLEHPHPKRPVMLQEAGQARRRSFKPGKDIYFPTTAGANYLLTSS